MMLYKGRQSVPELATFQRNYPALAPIQMEKRLLPITPNQLIDILVLSRYAPVLVTTSKPLRQSTKRFVGIIDRLGDT